MNWIALENLQQIEEIKSKSFERPQVILKHSSTCSISSMILNRLNRTIEIPEADFYFLDLLAYRQVSDEVSFSFSVPHESPQILLIKEGSCVYHESHYGIMMDEIIQRV